MAVLRQLRPPHRIVTILEGESLLNDASALLIYRLAVGATAMTALSIGRLVPSMLLVLVGSVVAGVVLARLFLWLLQGVRDVPTSIILQFISTFGVWILADRLGLSRDPDDGLLRDRDRPRGAGPDAGAAARAVLRGVGDGGLRPERPRLRLHRPAAAADPLGARRAHAGALLRVRRRRARDRHRRADRVGDAPQRRRHLEGPPLRLPSAAPGHAAADARRQRRRLVGGDARHRHARRSPGAAGRGGRGSVPVPRPHRPDGVRGRRRHPRAPGVDARAAAALAPARRRRPGRPRGGAGPPGARSRRLWRRCSADASRAAEAVRLEFAEHLGRFAVAEEARTPPSPPTTRCIAGRWTRRGER